ncbi:MAG: LLM class F420-dependent oxidoreductase [Thaumarchaeota archaeon]|nr:LLM class F420-dependent oxidoreductase [Nitrososphaerota archaeon]
MERFGFQQPNHTFGVPNDQVYNVVEKIALEAEHYGFDSFYVMDHLMQISSVNPPEDPILEGWMTIAALAVVTQKMKLSTMVTCNTFRNPALLAKMAASVDNISNGRLILAIGAGWYELEHKAYGIHLGTMRERFQRLMETLQIVKKMWTEDKATFEGKYYRIKNAICNPKPIQKPHPMIMVGGDGEKVTLKIVAQYANACNVFGGADLERVSTKLSALKQHCKDVGRDYNSIFKTGLARVIIGKNESSVKEKIKKWVPQKPTAGATGVTTLEDRLKRFVIGTPEQCAETFRKIFATGLDYVVVNFPDSHNLETVKLFGEGVLPKFH